MSLRWKIPSPGEKVPRRGGCGMRAENLYTGAGDRLVPRLDDNVIARSAAAWRSPAEKFDLHPHPCRMRLRIKGLSHGLKIARRLSIFAPVCHWCRPFESLPPGGRKNKREAYASLLFFGTAVLFISKPHSASAKVVSTSSSVMVFAPSLWLYVITSSGGDCTQ